ncbi:MAG: hypothetical protein SFY66_21570 [Oculatellaceae cyanobacterium bins.114]|nr:hypothetical protein [Oculatellaceae cyanobacterium bins.114]
MTDEEKLAIAQSIREFMAALNQLYALNFPIEWAIAMTDEEGLSTTQTIREFIAALNQLYALNLPIEFDSTSAPGTLENLPVEVTRDEDGYVAEGEVNLLPSQSPLRIQLVVWNRPDSG